MTQGSPKSTISSQEWGKIKWKLSQAFYQILGVHENKIILKYIKINSKTTKARK